MRKTILCLIVGGLFGPLLLVTGQGQMKPEDTEDWSHVPTVVGPGRNGGAPSDAVVLFKKKEDAARWENGKGEAIGWKSSGGKMSVVKGAGDIRTDQEFGDCQFHIEWRTPRKVISKGQGRGNSGIFLMGKYEVQVLDSYQNQTYSNGQAGSIYKQHIPLVNVCRKPHKWQCYDIIFKAPRFKASGELISPAYLTVIHNGVLIQNHVALSGPTLYIGHPTYKAHPEKLPLVLQDHGNPVQYRNIWIREL